MGNVFNKQNLDAFGDVMKRTFSPQGIKNMGIIAGKSIGTGLVTGATLGSALFAPQFLPELIPEAIKANIGFGTTIFDVLKHVGDGKTLGEIDVNETADKVFDSKIGRVIDGVTGMVPSLLPNLGKSEKSLSHLSTVVNRGTGKTPVGQLSRIATPFKHLYNTNGVVGQASRATAHSVSFHEGLRTPSSLISTRPGGLIDPPSFIPPAR